MAGQLQQVVRGLRGLTLGQTLEGATDAALLSRFVREQDETAFAALVRRHGPLVLGVCRRVLKNPHDADDAFQAAFLVLVRRAGSIRRPGALANWLYGVAYRTALVVKRAARRRRAKEASVAPPEQPPDQSELLAVLDQELSGLPDKFREAVVLCDLQGKTRKEAARHLGCREGTVASRLGRGREMLARRLRRQGFGLSAGALAVVLSRASAAVPASLVVGTEKAAGVSTVAAAAIVALTERVMKVMLINKLKAMGAAVLLVGVLATGGVVSVGRAPADEAKKPAAPRADTRADEEFLRRACLDIRGNPPTAIEVDYFLRDRRPDKRAWLVRKLREEARGKEASALLLRAALWADVESRRVHERDTGPLLFGAGRERRVLGRWLAEAAKNPEALAAQAQAEVDGERLQGMWEVVSYERDGKAVPAAEWKGLRLIFQGDRVSSCDSGEIVEVNLFLLRAGKKPRVLRLTQLRGPEPGLNQAAIYEFAGDRLRLCANRRPGGPVPTEFRTQPDSGLELYELRRVPAAGKN